MYTSPEKEWNLCGYLVDRINKLIPMCKAVRTTTLMRSGRDEEDPKEIATIVLMNGKKIYITNYKIINDRVYNCWTTWTLKHITFCIDGGKHIVFYNFDGFDYNFYKYNNYKELSISIFMQAVSELISNDVVTLIEE